MLREAVKNQTELGMKAKQYMDSGALVPNDLIIGLMKEKIAAADGKVILDGFPRTIEQADALSGQLDVDLALNLDVKDEELIKRIPDSYIPVYKDVFTLPYTSWQIRKDFGFELKDHTHIKLILERKD